MPTLGREHRAWAPRRGRRLRRVEFAAEPDAGALPCEERNPTHFLSGRLTPASRDRMEWRRPGLWRFERSALYWPPRAALRAPGEPVGRRSGDCFG